MSRRTILLASLLLLPTLAVAQKSGATKRTPMFDNKDDGPKGPSLRPRDIEDQSPIKLLIDKRKDLKLSDAQLNTLKASETKLKTTMEPLLKAVDSLVHDAKPPMNETVESKVRVTDARQGLMETVRTISSTYDASAKEALATFDPDQQKKATELLDKLREDSDKMLREKMGGGMPRSDAAPDASSGRRGRPPVGL